MAPVTSKHSMIILEKGGRGLLVHVVWLWFISSLFLCRFHRHVWRRAGSVPAARTSIWWVSITTTVKRYLYPSLSSATTILYLLNRKFLSTDRLAILRYFYLCYLKSGPMSPKLNTKNWPEIILCEGYYDAKFCVQYELVPKSNAVVIKWVIYLLPLAGLGSVQTFST